MSVCMLWRYGMNRLFYPAVFHREEKGYWVSFPDLPECLTEGDDMEQAYAMAADALGLALVSRKKEGQIIPAPSRLDDICTEEGYPVLVQFDLMEYQRKHNAKAVKKTLSIPEWLNEEALARGINFSQVLQEALIQKIQAK